MKTTLNKIKEHDPFEPSWKKLLKSLGKTEADDTELSIRYILELLGVEDAVWALRAVEGKDKEIRMFACDYLESILHVFEEKYPNDTILRTAIDVARKFANEEATKEELKKAAWVALAACEAWFALAACEAWFALAACEAWVSWDDTKYVEKEKLKEFLLKYI